MPRTAQSNGVRSEIKALAVLQMNKPVTPKEINDHVKTGDYAAKYISMLKNTWNFQFTTQRDGRKIVSYTLVGEPANAAALRAMQPVAPKAAKKSAPVAAKTMVVTKTKVATSPAVQKAAASISARKMSVKPAAVDVVEQQLGTTDSVGAVDADWDSVDNLNFKVEQIL